MNNQIVECVPNFSEGRNREVIERIANAIKGVEGVKLLHIDSGEAANRSVMTFIGSPTAISQAAFLAVECAAKNIDMRQQHGEHPRLGATDVLPIIPIRNITLEECAQLARELAERIARELAIPIYLYEAAAIVPHHRNLADSRRGEYEGLAQRLISENDAPDIGARPFDEIIAKSGAINLGARKLLLAVNFNLRSTSVEIASAIAADIRESGRVVNGKRIGGILKACKAIGWYIEEYGIAQVSVNLVDLETTPLHIAFEHVQQAARKRGVEVTGTEIIGLIPQNTLLQAGEYYNKKNSPSKEELLSLAVQKLKLDDLEPFDLQSRVLGF